MDKTVCILFLIGSAFMQAFAVAVMKKASSISKEEVEIQGKSHRKVLLMAITFLLFGASFPLYAIGLSGLNLAVAQPLFSATMFVSTIVLSVLLFHERVNLQRIAGVTVIITGIITVIT